MTATSKLKSRFLLLLALGALLLFGVSWTEVLRAENHAIIAYVAMGTGKAITLVDLRAGRVLKTFALSVEPHGVAVSKNGTHLFAADLTKGEFVEVLDVQTGRPHARLKVGRGLAPSDSQS